MRHLAKHALRLIFETEKSDLKVCVFADLLKRFSYSSGQSVTKTTVFVNIVSSPPSNVPSALVVIVTMEIVKMSV